MHRAGGYRDIAMMLAIPTLIVALGCAASLLPPSAVATVLNFLVAWTCLSVPLAVLIGHCVLSED